LTYHLKPKSNAQLSFNLHQTDRQTVYSDLYIQYIDATQIV